MALESESLSYQPPDGRELVARAGGSFRQHLWFPTGATALCNCACGGGRLLQDGLPCWRPDVGVHTQVSYPPRSPPPHRDTSG